VAGAQQGDELLVGAQCQQRKPDDRSLSTESYRSLQG
jgi:hypothetical protein